MYMCNVVLLCMYKRMVGWSVSKNTINTRKCDLILKPSFFFHFSYKISKFHLGDDGDQNIATLSAQTSVSGSGAL